MKDYNTVEHEVNSLMVLHNESPNAIHRLTSCGHTVDLFPNGIFVIDEGEYMAESGMKIAQWVYFNAITSSE